VSLNAGVLAIQPKIGKEFAEKLHRVVGAEKSWASVGFSCARLGGDVTRVISVWYPSINRPPQDFPRWFAELASALQALLVLELPAYRRWLPAAVQNPPKPVPITVWGRADVTLWMISVSTPEDKKTEAVEEVKRTA